MKKSILCIAGTILLVSLYSCNITIYGLTSDYSKLSEKYKKQIVFSDGKENICELEKDDKIHVTTGSQLRKCIETQDSVFVYLWNTQCHSKFCYPLSYFQSYCDSHGYKLYVVAQNYDETKMSAQQKSILQPLLSINDAFYKTKYRNKYIKLFAKDLVNDPTLPKKTFSRNNIYIFSYGKLVSSLPHLEEEPDRWEVIKP
jgi:phage pi2 protein 07